jgi:hypothetical protein
MRLLGCLLLLFIVGCESGPAKAYEGEKLPPESVATIHNSYEASLVSVDGVQYHSDFRDTPGYLGFVYHLKPGLRRIEVGRRNIEGWLNHYELVDDPGLRATFTIDVKAGQSLYFVVEKMRVDDQLVWNVQIADREAGRLYSPTVPPKKGGRVEEIRGLIDRDLRPLVRRNGGSS